MLTLRPICKVFSLIFPLEVMPQAGAEIGIKVKEFANKFNMTTASGEK